MQRAESVRLQSIIVFPADVAPRGPVQGAERYEGRKCEAFKSEHPRDVSEGCPFEGSESSHIDDHMSSGASLPHRVSPQRDRKVNRLLTKHC